MVREQPMQTRVFAPCCQAVQFKSQVGFWLISTGFRLRPEEDPEESSSSTHRFCPAEIYLRGGHGCNQDADRAGSGFSHLVAELLRQ
jgi:hypothetical protein